MAVTCSISDSVALVLSNSNISFKILLHSFSRATIKFVPLNYFKFGMFHASMIKLYGGIRGGGVMGQNNGKWG